MNNVNAREDNNINVNVENNNVNVNNYSNIIGITIESVDGKIENLSDCDNNRIVYSSVELERNDHNENIENNDKNIMNVDVNNWKTLEINKS